MEIVEIDGMPLHYTVQGSGAPLILMHGWGCNHSTVDTIAQAAALSHTVYNVDFPGFGETPEPSEVWGVEEYTRLIEGMASKLGIENPTLIGHSFGGRVGILFASRNAVDKLVLVDAAGVKPRRSLKYYYKVYSFKLMKRVLRLVYGKEKAAEMIERQRTKRGSADYNNASHRMKAILSKVVNEDLCHVMPAIKARTLMLWGEKDTATPLRDAKKMRHLIVGSELVSFPGCGHYSFLDNPIGFRTQLRKFLKS